MSCPTCDHTMQCINTGWWWCPRCGTLQGGVEADRPKLVDYCRSFEKTIEPGRAVWTFAELWVSTGIQESIFPPDERREFDNCYPQEEEAGPQCPKP